MLLQCTASFWILCDLAVEAEKCLQAPLLRGACPVSFSHHANLSRPKHPVVQFVASLATQTSSSHTRAEALTSIVLNRPLELAAAKPTSLPRDVRSSSLRVH